MDWDRIGATGSSSVAKLKSSGASSPMTIWTSSMADATIGREAPGTLRLALNDQSPQKMWTTHCKSMP